jgi:phage shock protein PspC (stress-responsive transcriptional regulator)
MRKVITVNLNGTAFQLEEDGYETLHGYLESAARRLAGNPDRAEILSDLEQAIADKCTALLGARRNVVTAEDIARVIEQMGPVEAPPGLDDVGVAEAVPGREPRRGRRLYRLPDEGVFFGICAGIAAWLNTDPVWIRLAAVVLTIAMGGMLLLIYPLMIFIMPRAETPEQVAEAHGAGLDAREIFRRAKKKFTVKPAADPRTAAR